MQHLKHFSESNFTLLIGKLQYGWKMVSYLNHFPTNPVEIKFRPRVFLLHNDDISDSVSFLKHSSGEVAECQGSLKFSCAVRVIEYYIEQAMLHSLGNKCVTSFDDFHQQLKYRPKVCKVFDIRTLRTEPERFTRRNSIN